MKLLRLIKRKILLGWKQSFNVEIENNIRLLLLVIKKN